ncbi:MAG: tetratricopeptide repeat protein [Ferruginibacter sp.]|nr:tetratricopeptide repeat protein [Cytophagales bacterium]
MALGVLATFGQVKGQDSELANEYFQKGDYEKARTIYQKLAKNENVAKQVYKKYVVTLAQLNEYSEAEKFLRRLIKNNAGEPLYKAEYGLLLEKQGKDSEARKQYEQTIDAVKSDPTQLNSLAQYFIEADKLPRAEEAYLAGRKNAKNPSEYAYQLAGLYKIAGQKEKMIEEYLNLGLTVKNSEEFIQNSLQDELVKAEDFDLLKKILIERVQKYPNQSLYSDLLIWHYIQQKDFYRAFVQARSTDKRYKLEGSKLMEIGMISIQNTDYKSAEQIFEYLTREYTKSPNYPVMRRYLVQAKEELVKNTYPVNPPEIRSLIVDYQKLFDELGRNYKTMEGLRNMALLHAFYLNEKDTAVTILEQAIRIAPNDRNFVDRCKMDLGDIYLLKNEPWESALLYAQVEKAEKEQPIGYEAKLKNAKLSYFKGEFALAQEHLDVLKMATSREIANDAMDLSLLIQDNTGLDSTETAMREYASVELLVFQNQYEEVMNRLNQMQTRYKDHSLADEILWLQANVYLKLNENQKAFNNLEKIVKEYKYDILSDDAHFLMAKILEEKLDQKEKAMELYQEHLKNYPGSIFTAEARKRFRFLRKDFPN